MVCQPVVYPYPELSRFGGAQPEHHVNPKKLRHRQACLATISYAEQVMDRCPIAKCKHMCKAQPTLVCDHKITGELPLSQ
eukprot:237874-Alexandrium_andersonii.AAC.1